MVDVSMREQDERNLSGVEGEGGEVERLLLLTSLMHAAIDEEAGLTHLHHIVRPGDLTGGSADLQEHTSSSGYPVSGQTTTRRVPINVCAILRWCAAGLLRNDAEVSFLSSP